MLEVEVSQLPGFKIRQIQIKIPARWQKCIDEAREDMDIHEWVQMVIRDALINAGKWPPKDDVE